MLYFFKILTQKWGSLSGLATDEAVKEWLQSVSSNSDTQPEGSPVNKIVFLLSIDTEQKPGQNQCAS